MRYKGVFFFVIVFIFIQCKSNQTGLDQSNDGKEVQSLLLLLSNEVSPSELEVVKSFGVKSFKKTSRSQNLWMVDVQNLDTQGILSLKEQLRSDSRVLEVRDAESGSAIQSSTNSKSGKTGPIKNR